MSGEHRRGIELEKAAGSPEEQVQRVKSGWRAGSYRIEEKDDSTEPSRGSRKSGRGAALEEKGLGRPGRGTKPGKQVQGALGGGGRPNPRAHGAGKAWGWNKVGSQVPEKMNMSFEDLRVGRRT